MLTVASTAQRLISWGHRPSRRLRRLGGLNDPRRAGRCPLCAGHGHLLRVRPFIIARRYT